MSARPAAPRDLHVAGRRLWRAITTEYEMGPHELALLREAARCVDELEGLRAALREAEPLVEGSTGQHRSNPLFDEARKHRELLGRLLERLALPGDEQSEGRSAASQRASRAARARWKE